MSLEEKPGQGKVQVRSVNSGRDTEVFREWCYQARSEESVMYRYLNPALWEDLCSIHWGFSDLFCKVRIR